MNANIRTFKIIFAYIFLNSLKIQNIGVFATNVQGIRHAHRLQSRSLLFPPTAPTRLQFIGGIGIPVEDLSFESVTSGYVLKAEYFLPEKAEEFRQKLKPQTIHRRRRSSNNTASLRTNYLNSSELNYKVKDSMFTHQGLSSSETQNREIYRNHIHQQNFKNWNYQPNHGAPYRWIVYKAIEILLNKSSLNGNACLLRSICELAAVPLNYEGGLLAELIHIVLTPSSSSEEYAKSTHKNYLRAESLGRSGENCAKAFNRCSKSPLEIISLVLET